MFRGFKRIRKLEEVEIPIKIVDGSYLDIPEYKTDGAAGCDLMANIKESITLDYMGMAIIPTGIMLELPVGIEGQVRSRSGTSSNGLMCLNGIGTIDWDYRGEIHIPVINFSKKPFTINRGDKIGQLVFNRVVRAKFKVVDKLSETKRGSKGFGSTGIK